MIFVNLGQIGVMYTLCDVTRTRTGHAIIGRLALYSLWQQNTHIDAYGIMGGGATQTTVSGINA